MDNFIHSPARKRARIFDIQQEQNEPGKAAEVESESGGESDSRLYQCLDSLASTTGEEDIYQPGTQTELETSLAPVESSQEAINEYESLKASVVDGPKEQDIQGRYDDRTWVKGKSSIYVDAFNLTLKCVLDEEPQLFDDKERALFDLWKQLPYESQYLYVRLFLRKTAAWHRISRLGYYHDIGDMPAAIEELRLTRPLPAASENPAPIPVEIYSEANMALGDQFQFAEGLEEITTVEEASSLLLLDELKELGRQARVQGKTKKELLKALQGSVKSQTGLSWPCSFNSLNSNLSEVDRAGMPVPKQLATDSRFLKKVLNVTGDCIRLSLRPLKLFERVHLIFYRSTEWTEKSLTTIILAKISRKNYPDFIVSRTNGIFPTRAILLEFERAIRIQFDLDNAMESSNISLPEKLQTIQTALDSVYPRWKTLLTEEQYKEDQVYDMGEGAYLRRFSPAWVYTRIVHKGLYVLGRLKNYGREHSLLSELLDQCLFHPSRRGAWYQRKALLEEHYMWNLLPSDALSEDARRKKWKRYALKTCERGLEDPHCHIIYHYDLQKRIMKLEKSLNIAKREQHDFSHVMLAKPEERTVEGIRVNRELPTSLTSKTSNIPNSSARGRPTVWIDELEDGSECRVENMCLSWYRKQGWKGYHCEGGILRTLFGLLFYDVIFTYVPNVFQTPFQTCPLDLHTDAFYSCRISEINRRLAQISNGEAQGILEQVHKRECEKQTCAIGIDWSFELSDLLEIVQCFRGEALATICKVMAQEYQQRGGGVPDLFLWSTEVEDVLFVEVKSPNDRLSDTQRLWIHVLTGAGVKVELCNAVAREVRHVQ
ncbi:hypothetical protein LOZ65_006499 [Ophidiomyces ophidiicola]|nr:hypothetical protein LOZ65_006499 [Ophidiomyces ophidiicola]